MAIITCFSDDTTQLHEFMIILLHAPPTEPLFKFI